MPRVQVYLDDELHRRLKEMGLSPSELLQQAVRDEIRKQELEAAADEYLTELIAEVGEPSAADREYAQNFVATLTPAAQRRAG
jgi:post-segregation antitoxin (ccd killing protein)